jgi:transcription elongation factor GreA
MDSSNTMTADGFEALRAEVEVLETEGRAQIAAQIKTAREFGDLKENAEYHAAKEAQAHLETKIATLRTRLKTAEIVEVTKGGDVVAFGSSVVLSDEQTGKELRYTLVSQRDADASQGLLSAESPVAVALRGRRPGEVAVVHTPRGQRRLKIVSVD